jgi:RNA polymerase sigma factor (sigma-70 family)
MRDNPVINDLVTRARNGDQQAWDALVERYAPLVWSICRRHRLGGTDADDVGRRVWLQLMDQLDRVRDPAALPGWLATTTRRECGRFQRAARETQGAEYKLSTESIPDQHAGMAEQELLAERHATLREAFTHLPACCQQLIALLIEDPPVPYAQISARLGIPVGSIGPARSRCLDKLRRYPAIVALINASKSAADPETDGQAAAQLRRSADGSRPAMPLSPADSSLMRALVTKGTYNLTPQCGGSRRVTTQNDPYDLTWLQETVWPQPYILAATRAFTRPPRIF